MIRMRRKQARSGALLICVLVCLLVSSAMVTATTLSALQSRRNVRLQHQMRQTELLLDAGVLRAASQLQRSNQYQGETWRPNSEWIRFDDPLVEIQILRVETTDDSTRVEVVATLGAQGAPRRSHAWLTKRTHTFSIQHSEITLTPESSTAE